MYSQSGCSSLRLTAAAFSSGCRSRVLLVWIIRRGMLMLDINCLIVSYAIHEATHRPNHDIITMPKAIFRRKLIVCNGITFAGRVTGKVLIQAVSENYNKCRGLASPARWLSHPFLPKVLVKHAVKPVPSTRSEVRRNREGFSMLAPERRHCPYPRI